MSYDSPALPPRLAKRGGLAGSGVEEGPGRAVRVRRLLKRAGDSTRSYGSVGARDIAFKRWFVDVRRNMFSSILFSANGARSCSAVDLARCAS